tara:strand:+ start:82 stop:495 length:414 start_codon:yes stop_codon:yes gene_type:complete
MKSDLLVVVFCYSINPFIRKKALSNLSLESGYALIQTTTTIGNLIYLYTMKNNIELKNIKYINVKLSLLSSILTILSSYKMNVLLKNNNISNLSSKIQVLTILNSYLIDYNNIANMNKQQITGLIFMLIGIILTKTK